MGVHGELHGASGMAVLCYRPATCTALAKQADVREHVVWRTAMLCALPKQVRTRVRLHATHRTRFSLAHAHTRLVDSLAQQHDGGPDVKVGRGRGGNELHVVHGVLVKERLPGGCAWPCHAMRTRTHTCP